MSMENSYNTIGIRTCDLLAGGKKDYEKQVCTDVLMRNGAVAGTKDWREGDN
jgi:hypothetical protein